MGETRSAAGLVAVALALGGCGTQRPATEKAKVVETVKAFQTAILDHDGGKYCDLLTGAEKRNIITRLAPLGGGVDCAKAIEKAYGVVGEDDLEKTRVAREKLAERDVRVTGAKSTVTLPSGKKLRLTKSGDKWLISDTGVSTTSR